MIVLDAHESQGFAIQEALACDVPLLVWDATSMNQEEGAGHPDLPSTSVPYWNEKCGEVFTKWAGFENKFNLFLQNIKNDNYEPRKFIINELSVKPCSVRFAEFF